MWPFLRQLCGAARKIPDSHRDARPLKEIAWRATDRNALSNPTARSTTRRPRRLWTSYCRPSLAADPYLASLAGH
eukprot:11221811-Lingulodinium_polyedra.AAC.1